MGLVDHFRFLRAAMRMSPSKPVENYRLYNQLYKNGHESVARRLETLNRILTGAEISCSTTIGERLHIPHPAGIVIGGLCKIGDDCSLFPQVTLGYRVGGDVTDGHPNLGDRVIVGAGARIIGPITIGNDVHVGANAVVLADIPTGSIAVGIPARIVGSSKAEKKKTPESVS